MIDCNEYALFIHSYFPLGQLKVKLQINSCNGHFRSHAAHMSKCNLVILCTSFSRKENKLKFSISTAITDGNYKLNLLGNQKGFAEYC